MLKQLFVLFNLASLIVVTALLPADVKVDTSIPDQMKRDSTYLVEISIDKAEIFGFAKYQQDLPPGFQAEAVETAEASFTFADNKVKFIWMALPEEKQIKISYKITPTAEAPKEGVVEGKFSYIEENERKSYDLPNINIKVLGEDDVPKEIEPEARVMRMVESTGENEFLVTLSVEKKGITGFSKIEEYLPPGAEAEAQEAKLAVFSQVDDKAKFVWMSIPAEDEFVVTYKVKADKDIEDALNSMEGNFSFLDEDESKTVPVIGAGPLAKEEPELAMEEEEEPIVEDDSVEEGDIEEEVAAVIEEPKEEVVEEVKPKPQPKEEPKEIAKATPKPKETPITRTPNPETGVRYRVQIVAGHKTVDEKYIAKTYNFNEPFSVENHEGWIKYTTGSFNVYKQARDKRESLVTAQHNFPGPFVTAYNSGERITVQEALMITNQKWVQ